MSHSSPSSSDEPLLRAWVRHRDEDAFRALAEKYTSLVFGTALRKTGRADWAEEVTQEVFVTFARRAPGLDGEGGLAGWLHRTAVLTAATRLRAESRRDQRMRKLAALSAHSEHPAPPPAHVSDRDWSLLRPVLDDAIAALPALDRRVILEHYFERKTYAEVAALAGLTHDAARKRGLRALEKLNRRLRRRGAVLSLAILGGGLSAAFRQSAPAALAAKAGAAGIASAGAAFIALGGVAALSFVTMKTTILSVSAVVLLAGSTYIYVRESAPSRIAESAANEGFQATVSQMPVPVTAAATPYSPKPAPPGTGFAPTPRPPVAPIPVSSSIPDQGKYSVALKEAFQNHPKTKLAEARINVFKKGFKRILDRYSEGFSVLTYDIGEAKKRMEDGSLSLTEREAAKTLAADLSAQFSERMAGAEKFRLSAETWLDAEVKVQRKSIFEEIENPQGISAPAAEPKEGIRVDGAVLERLKEGSALVEAGDYSAALNSYKAFATEATGKMREVADWNTMLCAILTENQTEVDAASSRLVREATAGAACFALAAQAIQRNEWADAQQWVNQAGESGDSTQNHFFKESFARLGWMESAESSLLIPPPKS